MASRKTKKATRKPAGRSRKTAGRATKKKAGRAAKAKKRPAKKSPAKKRPAKKRPAKKKAAAKKHNKKPAKKTKKTAKKAAKPKSARKPKAAARSISHSKAPVTSATRNQRVKLPPAGKTPKASLRRPTDIEERKGKLNSLMTATSQVRALKRTLNKSFYEIGQILRDIEVSRLYEVKNYASFEAFVEREVDLGKSLSLKIVRIVQVFLKDAALASGLERLSAALDALDGNDEEPSSGSATSSGTRSAIPLHKQ